MDLGGLDILFRGSKKKDKSVFDGNDDAYASRVAICLAFLSACLFARDDGALTMSLVAFAGRCLSKELSFAFCRSHMRTCR